MSHTEETKQSSSVNAGPATGAPPSLPGKIRRGLAGAIFWQYERGSWQYDVMVALILAFIFLTPRGFFHDRPRLELTDLRHVQGIVEVSHDKSRWIYLVDARLVKPGAEDLNAALGPVIARRVPGKFDIRSVAAVRDRNGVVLGYTVDISRP